MRFSDMFGAPRTQVLGRTRGWRRAFPALIWLGFILFPLIDALETHGSTISRILTIAAAAAFVGAYVWLVLLWKRRRRRALTVGLFAVLIGTSIALTLGSGHGWGFLFTYCAAVAALFSPTSIGWAGVVMCSALAAGSSALAGASGSTVLNYTVTSLGIGLLMVVMRDLRVRNDELSEARAELAQAAVAKERERFARDLHDLLGHTLSVIALKAELAGRLILDHPDRAATEVGEVEQVARKALGEVRLAASGYRQPTLEGELAGARMALSAAGITADIDAPTVTLQPDVEAVLAWAVREGATNVIRHSHATRCTVRVSAGLAHASVDVIDDGRGTGAAGAAVVGLGSGDAAGVSGTSPASSAPSPAGSAGSPGGSAGSPAGSAGSPAGSATSPAGGHRGHGLEGVRERAEAVNGRVEAGPLPDCGFRLSVTIPAPARGLAPHSVPASNSTPARNSTPGRPPTASPSDEPLPRASCGAPPVSPDASRPSPDAAPGLPDASRPSPEAPPGSPETPPASNRVSSAAR